MSHCDLDLHTINMRIFVSLPFEILYQFEYAVQSERLNYRKLNKHSKKAQHWDGRLRGGNNRVGKEMKSRLLFSTYDKNKRLVPYLHNWKLIQVIKNLPEQGMTIRKLLTLYWMLFFKLTLHDWRWVDTIYFVWKIRIWFICYICIHSAFVLFK